MKRVFRALTLPFRFAARHWPWAMGVWSAYSLLSDFHRPGWAAWDGAMVGFWIALGLEELHARRAQRRA